MEFFLPVIVLTLAGLTAGLGLAAASRYLHVFADPRISRICRVLPNVNCGACGFDRCADFAEAVAGGRAKAVGCVPGGPKAAAEISEILGLESAEGIEERMAVVHCKGGRAEAVERAVYDGVADCRAAILTGNAFKVCTDGCLGLGTCVRACPFGAMSVNGNGVAVVNHDRCSGCGLCVKACPRGIIELIPRVHRIYVACANHDGGARVTKYCSVGCTACALCVKATPSGAIVMSDSLPKLDYALNENFVTAAFKCPSRCFVDLVKARPKVNIDTKCDGCGECVPDCPTDAISGEIGSRHTVDKEKCIGCGICLDKCHVRAIAMWGGLAYSTHDKSRRLRGAT